MAVTRLGDLWLMSEHRLLCGDALKVEDIARVLDGGLADMVFTDPPYNVSYEGKSARRLIIANDALGSEFASFLEQACREMLSVSKGAIYICMSSAERDCRHDMSCFHVNLLVSSKNEDLVISAPTEVMIDMLASTHRSGKGVSP